MSANTDSSTINIKTFNTDFILDPPLISHNDPNSEYTQKCKVIVTVTEKVYQHEDDKPHWYYIDYSYEFIGKTGKCFKIDNPFMIPSNPFYGEKNATEEFEGTIIFKNSMTEQMIGYLIMPIDKLEKYTGTRCPYYYKKQIILSIANFW